MITFDYENAGGDFIVGPEGESIAREDNISNELGMVTLAIDRSGSESTESEGIRRIDSINEAVPAFVDKLANDRTVNSNTRLSIVQFNHVIETIQNWDKPSHAVVPRFEAAGGTDLDGALRTAIALGKDFANDIERVGGRTKVHNIVLVSDLEGCVSSEVEELIRKRDRTSRTFLWVFGVPGFDARVAQRIAPERTFTTTGTFDEGLKQFLDMIFKITKAISESAPGEQPKIDENPFLKPDNVLAVPDLNKLII